VLTTHLPLHVTLNYFAGFAWYLGGKDKSITVNQHSQKPFINIYLSFFKEKGQFHHQQNQIKSTHPSSTHMGVQGAIPSHK